MKVTELFMEEKRNGATGGRVATAHQRVTKEANYQRQAEQLLTDENCFKLVLVRPRFWADMGVRRKKAYL